MIKIFLGVLMSSAITLASVLPKHETKTLENGLQIVVIPIKNGSGVIETSVIYKVGSRNEIMGKSGLAHMIEHMNFKSTKNLKAGEFDNIVKSMGGASNASTSFDYTHYFIKSSSLSLDKSLELFSEIMANLRFSNEEFEPERKVVMQERLWRTDNSPFGYLFFRFFNTAFIEHPYHWTPIGFRNDIENWTLNDLKDFHSMYYQPKNAILLVTGDIDSNLVFELGEKYFKDIKNTQNIVETHNKESKQDGAREIHLKKDTGGVDFLALGFRTTDFKNEDQISLQALSGILGGGKSSVLKSILVDKLQMASSISAFNVDLKDDGLFFIVAVGNKGITATKLKNEILKQIDKLKKEGIKKEDLDKIKINTKADFIYSLDTSSSVAELFAPYLARGDLSPLLEYEKRTNDLKVEDITRVLNKYFLFDNSITATMMK